MLFYIQPAALVHGDPVSLIPSTTPQQLPTSAIGSKGDFKPRYDRRRRRMRRAEFKPIRKEALTPRDEFEYALPEELPEELLEQPIESEGGDIDANFLEPVGNKYVEPTRKEELPHMPRDEFEPALPEELLEQPIESEGDDIDANFLELVGDKYVFPI